MRLPLVVGLASILAFSGPASAQSCSIKYYGPVTESTTVLQPGHSVGGTVITSDLGQSGSVSSPSLTYSGRTGDKTFAFVQTLESKILVMGRVPETRREEKNLSVYWEGPTVPIKLAGYTFTLSLTAGETSMTMLDHPSEGVCPARGAARTPATDRAPATSAGGDVQRLLTDFALDLPTLQREGFNPTVPKVDACAPAPGDRTTIHCTGHSEAASEQLCRPDAMAPLVGLAQSGRQNGLASTYTLTCANHRVTVQRSKTGDVTVEQVETSTGTLVFSRAFTY
jgi:hypothetical protein